MERPTSRSSTTKSGGAVDGVLLALLAVSLAGNVYLGHLAFRGDPSREKTPRETLRVGSRIPFLEARDADGIPQKVAIAGTERPTVLFIFSPGCHWCAATLPQFVKLASARADEYTFLGLSVGTNTGGWTPNFPLFKSPTEATAQALHLGTVPETVVIGTDGLVKKVWKGAYGSSVARDIEDYFSFKIQH